MKTKNIALALALLALPAVVQAQFNWAFNGSEITITGYTGPGGDVTIPDTINGWPVKTIGNGAFYDNDFVTSVTIPNSVIVIGEDAFDSCTSLAGVTIHANTTSLAGSTFVYCSNMTNFNILNSITSIRHTLFALCTALSSMTN